MAEKEWFSTWFDTSYYHVLYRHRNDEEAATFIKHLINKLNLPKNSSVLDLACGKGRHSVMLHQAGFDVLGVDLSKNSISLAKQNEEDKLSFEVHDMRETMENKQFDAVFNLFTSFGYFDNSNENKKVVDAVRGGDLLVSTAAQQIGMARSKRRDLAAQRLVARRRRLRKWHRKLEPEGGTDGHSAARGDSVRR